MNGIINQLIGEIEVSITIPFFPDVSRVFVHAHIEGEVTCSDIWMEAVPESPMKLPSFF